MQLFILSTQPSQFQQKSKIYVVCKFLLLELAKALSYFHCVVIKNNIYLLFLSRTIVKLDNEQELTINNPYRSCPVPLFLCHVNNIRLENFIMTSSSKGR